MRPADSALGIFRSPDHDICVPGRRILRPREPCLYKPLLSITLNRCSSDIVSSFDCFRGYWKLLLWPRTSDETTQNPYDTQLNTQLWTLQKNGNLCKFESTLFLFLV